MSLSIPVATYLNYVDSLCRLVQTHSTLLSSANLNWLNTCVAHQNILKNDAYTALATSLSAEEFDRIHIMSLNVLGSFRTSPPLLPPLYTLALTLTINQMSSLMPSTLAV